MADDVEPGGRRDKALTDTIFALSSGRPPAAIAIVRISGPDAIDALRTLSPAPVEPRRAALRTLRDPVDADVLDRALVLVMPGPATATGEDVVELHLHGGRAVVAAVERVLSAQPGLRAAKPGEFTHRAFEHGRIDLSEAQGLADLLVAETERQRRAAQAMAEGGLRRLVSRWQAVVIDCAAACEAALDFGDEDDVTSNLAALRHRVAVLAEGIARRLDDAPAERLRDGVRVVIAGPPNAGKSTLLNAIVGRDAAIVSPISGTTRDRIDAPVVIRGLPFVITDTAGLRASDDVIECLGIERARQAVDAADVVIWLGDPHDAPRVPLLIQVEPKSDMVPARWTSAVRVSGKTGDGIAVLLNAIVAHAQSLLPSDTLALHAYQRAALASASEALTRAALLDDEVLLAEELRFALSAFDRITGAADVEAVLDAVFGSFCIGK